AGSRRAGVLGAGRARASPRRPGKRGPDALGAGTIVTLGGSLRSAREPAKRRARRPESPRRLATAPRWRQAPQRHTLCCITRATCASSFSILNCVPRWEPLHREYAIAMRVLDAFGMPYAELWR